MTMNRLIISEGGQPVYLEDLKMLQDNMIDLILSLFPLTFGGGGSFDDGGIINVLNLPVYATPRHTNGSSDANYDWIQAHKLITKNAIYDVPETKFGEVGIDDLYDKSFFDLYYVLNEETVEKREFEDGISRPVIKSYTAKIVGTKPESGVYYKFTDVPSLDDLQYILASKYSFLKKTDEGQKGTL